MMPGPVGLGRSGGSASGRAASLRSELVRLSRHLRQERLFVTNEKESLSELYEKVQSLGSNLGHAAWIDHQERVNLDRLILHHSEPQHSCHRANILQQTRFVDAYRELHHHEPLYSEFLRTLREKPQLLAQVLVEGDKLGFSKMADIESTILAGLYGSCLMNEDETLTLELLHFLMVTQLSASNDPRKLLRKGKCAFSRLYKAFNDQLFSAKIFLTSALYDPILSLLTDDEIFLDIDPSKTIIRFLPADRIKKFGIEGTPEYKERLNSHRRFIVGKLENLTRKFISGIRDNMHCFPPAISRLLRSMYALLVKSFEPKVAHSVCVDVVFYLFICPAMVDPNPVGIIDTPISYIARSNLMQVAQILQVLCMRKWAEVDSFVLDLYSRFDKDIMSPIIEAIWERDDDLDKNENSIEPTASGEDGKLSRLAVLMTKTQLYQLINFLRTIQPLREGVAASELSTLLSPLPEIDNNSDGEISINESEKVLVIPLCSDGHEIPGCLAEDVVIARANQNSKVRRNFPHLLPNSGESGEIIEKRTRFSLGHDEGSIGNTSDNLEVISEAASNHSVGSSLEDEVNQADDRIDNLSDMISANVSGRGTPNVSGRDTPSSQVANENDDVQPPVDPPGRNNDRSNCESTSSGRKNCCQPDLEEQFGRFEIKPSPSSGAGAGGPLLPTTRSETGDETISLISDTWSIDVLASDTETLGDERQRCRAQNLEELVQNRDYNEQVRNRLLDDLVVPTASANSVSSMRPYNIPSVLDAGDTASEVWSMDVLASDSESLRLAELENEEDSTSVAQSDDTRFTDDTTRSDPPESINLLDAFKSGGKLKASSRTDAVEQWAIQSRGVVGGRRSSDGGRLPNSINEKIRTAAENAEDASSMASSVSFGDKPVAANISTPSSSTGAIPKSISFDKASVSEHEKKRSDKSFFKNWKLPKIGRKNVRGELSRSSSERLNSPADAEPLRRVASDETSDDILAKYRTTKVPLVDLSVSDSNEMDDPAADERLIMDPDNLETSYAFQDAKRKLRLMLSSADLSMLNDLSRNYSQTSDNEVVWLLKVQLAEAHNLGDRNMVAQLHETLRCLDLFDNNGASRIVRSLREEYQRRSPYIAYLVRCRQGLLCSLSYQERLLGRMNVDRAVCTSYLVSVIVRLFLEKRDKCVKQFVLQFEESTVLDEKILLMEKFMSNLKAELSNDSMWISASEEQISLAHIAIERSVTSHIYMNALYPNGDADVSRDEVLSQHIRRLSSIITPGHKDLKIPRQYHYETPWPSAQAEIRRLAAFKTPSDKVACVVRTSQIILNLLSLNQEKSVAAADDFVPVLVFVIIKANPPSLLSSIQYVDSFSGDRLSGEEQYWWTQFMAAIEFIKTMDY